MEAHGPLFLPCGEGIKNFLELFLVLFPHYWLLGHDALMWLVGFRMAGFVLSGSGIRVIVLGNMGLWSGGWGKYRSVTVTGEGGVW